MLRLATDGARTLVVDLDGARLEEIDLGTGARKLIAMFGAGRADAALLGKTALVWKDSDNTVSGWAPLPTARP